MCAFRAKPNATSMLLASTVACLVLATGCGAPSQEDRALGSGQAHSAAPIDVASATSATSGKSATQPPAESDAPYTSIYADTIDWRTGGRALYLRADGSGLLRVAGTLANNQQPEKRYKLPPDTARYAQFVKLLDGATSIQADVPMAPGDNSARLWLRMPQGKTYNLEGPQGRNPEFGVLMDRLDKAISAVSIEGLPLDYEGNRDPSWAPPTP